MYQQTKISAVPTTAKVVETILSHAEKYQWLKIPKSWINANQETQDWELKQAAENIVALLAAMHAERSVFFHLVKYPKGGLEKGRHWYELWYITPEGKREIFWPCSDEIARIIGMDVNNRDRNERKYLFSSGAIGMSRILSATTSFAGLLAACCDIDNRGGCDWQFSHEDVL